MATETPKAEGPRPGDREAVVSFTTKLQAEYQVPEDQLVVPADLARYGLSEVVNRLLALEKPVPFDFLVDGQFLRTSIAQYLKLSNRSSEQVLSLEYVLALSEPEVSQVDVVPDWIADIVPLQNIPSTWFAAVSYDGTVRLYEDDHSRLVVKMSDAPLTCAASLPSGDNKGCRLVLGCKDGTTRCCVASHFHPAAGSAAAVGPSASLFSGSPGKAAQAVALNDDGTLLASAGWDLDINVWNAENDLFMASDEQKKEGKRRAPSDGTRAAPKFTLKGHSQVVTRLRFGARERFPFSLLSASWDCSVRVWDIAAAECVCNWTVARAATDLTLSPVTPPQLATAHEDGHVSIWDLRAAPHQSIKGALSLDSTTGLPLNSAQVPHRRLTSKVAWCPEDATRIASVGHDGRLCILDPRSPKMPLQSVQVGKGMPCPTKLLCLTWLARSTLAIGGSDGKVHRVSLEHGKPTVEEMPS
jgi:ribosome biogenesis protein YTM1